jgi:hypothetical protein
MRYIDKARRIAANIAKLPGLLKKAQAGRPSTYATGKPYPQTDIRRRRTTYMQDIMVRQMLGPFRRNDICTTPRTLISKCSVHGRLLGFRPFLS